MPTKIRNGVEIELTEAEILALAEQEAEYQARLDAEAAKGVRTIRNAKLTETDWMGMSDVTMPDAWATYRQALRDITGHDSFPNLADEDWPTKPE
jgi:tRNA G26 N,N-dimethylase Trm1